MNKEAKVHRLPNTEGVVISNGSRLFMRGNEFYNPYAGTFTANHLYITTDEKPKKGEWCYAPSLDRVFQITSDAPLPNEARKIIATTDPKLTIDVSKEHEGMYYAESKQVVKQLPQIPQYFIEEYCKAGGIDKVLVEYECIGEKGLIIADFSKDEPETIHRTELECIGYIAKTDSNNCIIIHPVEEKMYSLEEMEDIHVSVVKQGCLYEGGDWSDEHERLVRLEFNKWIKENL